MEGNDGKQSGPGFVDGMREETWNLNQQELEFDSAGNLINGQHRLLSIAKEQDNGR